MVSNGSLMATFIDRVDKPDPDNSITRRRLSIPLFLILRFDIIFNSFRLEWLVAYS